MLLLTFFLLHNQRLVPNFHICFIIDLYFESAVRKATKKNKQQHNKITTTSNKQQYNKQQNNKQQNNKQQSNKQQPLIRQSFCIIRRLWV